MTLCARFGLHLADPKPWSPTRIRLTVKSHLKNLLKIQIAQAAFPEILVQEESVGNKSSLT